MSSIRDTTGQGALTPRENRGNLPALASELRRRALLDQEVRGVKNKTPDCVRRWMEVDADNARRMWEILRLYGWPGYRLVGEQGSGDAALLIQHADKDRRLQRFGLELLVESVDADDAHPSHIAYLLDRIRIHSGVPQRYGTQYARNAQGLFQMLPVEDPPGLDARRAELGIVSVAEFERQVRELHGNNQVLSEET